MPVSQKLADTLPALSRTLLVAVATAPIVFAAVILVRHWLPLPYADEWATPGDQIASWYRGTLSWSQLFRQHNEHRLFFPRLVYIPLALVGGWDVRREMALRFLVACASAFALYRLALRTNGSRASAAFAALVMNALLFSPREAENLLSSIDGGGYAVSCALLFALLTNLSTLSLRSKTLANAALAVVATFTFGNGLLLWPLAFPIDFRSGKTSTPRGVRGAIFCGVVYVTLGVAAIALYFFSYEHPALSAPFASPTSQIQQVADFFLRWLGGLFLFENPKLAGAIALFLFLTLAASAIVITRRAQGFAAVYPWLMLGAYTLASGLVVAIARVNFILQMATDVRYVALSVFIYVAIAGLALLIAQQLRKRFARVTASVLVIFALAFCWIGTFRKERPRLRAFVQKREHLLLVLRWSQAIPENPELAELSPYPETADTIQTLAEHDALRPRLISRTLAEKVRQLPETNVAAAGSLTEATLDAQQHLQVRGRAYRRADCVVIGYETRDGAWHLLGVTETNRGDFDWQISVGKSAIEQSILRAWAIDLASERAFPMAGAAQISRATK